MSANQITFILFLALSVVSILLRSRRASTRRNGGFAGPRPYAPRYTPPLPRAEELIAAGASPTVAQALAEGNHIRAIAAYRQENGVGLVEATQAIDNLLAHANTVRLMQNNMPLGAPMTPPSMPISGAGTVSYASPPQQQPGALSERVTMLIAQGQIIEAIKVYRQETGVGLREAKEAIDAMRLRDSVAAIMARGASERVATLLAKGAKRDAIKAYRQETGTDLSTAKSTINLFLAR